MTNPDARYGLKPLDGLNAASIKENAYYVPSSYGTALFVGDPVVITGTSNTAAVVEYNPGALQEINKATAGATNRITGVITGFRYVNGNTPVGANPYKPASTEAVVLVCDDPDALFVVQADSANPIAATDMSANANVVYTHSGDTTSGLSGAELNTASMTADATYQLQIMRLYNITEGNDLGTNADVVVRINLHSYAHGVAGV
jgi:hypothetical protein